MKRKALDAGGFTLLEVLVATVATALLLSAIYTVFSGAVRLRDRGMERLEQVQRRARAITLIRGDIRNTMAGGGVLAGTLIGDARGVDTRFPGYLRLTTTSARRDLEAGGSDLHEVEYFVVQDADDTRRRTGILARASNRHLLAVHEQTPPAELLLRGVEALELAFLSSGQWVDAWDADHSTNAPPQAIRVNIRFVEEDDASLTPDPIELVVPVVTEPRAAEEESTSDPQEGGA